MGNSSTVYAQELLRALDDTGMPYAVLHGADDLVTGAPMSDVDVVVGANARYVVTQLALRQDGLKLIQVWEYDAGSLATLWSTPDGSDGVQLDLLYDPRSRGRYRVDTAALLAGTTHGIWPPGYQRPLKRRMSS